MCQHDSPLEPVGTEPLAAGAVLGEAGRLAGLRPVHDPEELIASRGFADMTESPRGVIIEGATWIDPASGHAVEDAVVVLSRGRVLAVGTRDETLEAVGEVGSDATRIEAHGRFVLPGFVDVHVHANDFEAVALSMHHGATSMRSGSSTFYQDVALARVPAYAPGLVPRMLAAGIFVSPEQDAVFLADPALAPLAASRARITAPEDLAYITRVNLSRGAKVIKTRANPRAGLPEQDPRELVFGEEQIAAVVQAAQGAGVLCHAYSAEGIAGAVAAGVRSIEHGVFVTEETLARMASQGTYFTPTLFTLTSLADHADPTLAARGREYVPILSEAVRMAHEMGVTVVGGTDSSGTSHFMSIGDEARALAGAGLDALKVLRSITTEAAQLLGVAGDGIGRLVAGGAADVVVLGSNPLESSDALTDVQAVVAQGVVVRNDLG